jgi:hypothetical protein
VIDIACAEPAFLDLSFAGLEAIPRPGEERLAGEFLRSAGGGLPDLSRARAVFVKAREAQLRTGSPDPETAAAVLAEHAPVAVVTLGEDGAIAAGSEGTVRVGGVKVDAVDTTGAGDLFSAAYVWADHWGVTLEERLRWAVLYAAMSVRVATAVAGAAALKALLEEGARHGLTSPLRQPSAAMKEEQ